jgi:hypothetical protein
MLDLKQSFKPRANHPHDDIRSVNSLSRTNLRGSARNRATPCGV